MVVPFPPSQLSQLAVFWQRAILLSLWVDILVCRSFAADKNVYPPTTTSYRRATRQPLKSEATRSCTLCGALTISIRLAASK
jgi:hypothetical protein